MKNIYNIPQLIEAKRAEISANKMLIRKAQRIQISLEEALEGEEEVAEATIAGKLVLLGDLLDAIEVRRVESQAVLDATEVIPQEGNE